MNAHDEKAVERLVGRLIDTAESERALADALVANGKARGSHSLLHERHMRFYKLLSEAAAALAAPKEAGDALDAVMRDALKDGAGIFRIEHLDAEHVRITPAAPQADQQGVALAEQNTVINFARDVRNAIGLQESGELTPGSCENLIHRIVSDYEDAAIRRQHEAAKPSDQQGASLEGASPERMAHWLDCAQRCDAVTRDRYSPADYALVDAANMLREAARALASQASPDDQRQEGVDPDGYTSYGEFRWACDCDERMRADWTPVWTSPTASAAREDDDA